MDKNDKIKILITILVLVALMASISVETRLIIEANQTIGIELKSDIDANTTEINRLNDELESKQFERVAILRQIQTLIMEGKWSEVLATRVEK